MPCLQDKRKRQEVLPQHQYSLLFQHSAITEYPTLTSELLLNQSNTMTLFGRWVSNLFPDGSQRLLTYSNNYTSTHMIAYYNHCGLALHNCQHNGYGVVQSCQPTQAHTLVSLPGLSVQTPVLKSHKMVLICLDATVCLGATQPYWLPWTLQWYFHLQAPKLCWCPHTLTTTHFKAADMFISVLWPLCCDSWTFYIGAPHITANTLRLLPLQH
jgi:hypothetical protein